MLEILELKVTGHKSPEVERRSPRVSEIVIAPSGNFFFKIHVEYCEKTNYFIFCHFLSLLNDFQQCVNIRMIIYSNCKYNQMSIGL